MHGGRSGSGGTGFVPVPAELYDLLQESLKYLRLTGGAFDVTAGPLVTAWQRAAVLWVLLLAVTGVMINHQEPLGLLDAEISDKYLPDSYRSDVRTGTTRLNISNSVISQPYR